jgi:hypothetical protein
VTPTRVTTLVGLFVLGVATLFVTEGTLVRSGEPQFIPPITLGVALVFIGLILPVLAWPIRKVTMYNSDNPPPQPVSPSYATRVVLLAKAGALTGALLAGSGVGIVVFLATRLVITPAPLLLSLSTAIGGAVSLAAGLVAEKWCQMPPQSGDESGALESDEA